MNRRPEPYGDWRAILSKKDKAAYILIEAFLTLLSVFCCLIYLSVKSVIAFWDNSIIASSMQTGTFYVFPLCILILGAVCYIDAKYRRSGVTLFRRKSHSSKKEHVMKREKKAKAKKTTLWLSLLIICIMISLPGLFSRAVMDKDGTLHIYNSFNKETCTLSSDNVLSLSINATESRIRTAEETDVWLTVYYEDGKEYSFNMESFIGSEDYSDSYIEGMIRIKELMSHKEIAIYGRENLNAFAEAFELSENEMELLDKLFER